MLLHNFISAVGFGVLLNLAALKIYFPPQRVALTASKFRTDMVWKADTRGSVTDNVVSRDCDEFEAQPDKVS